MNLTLDSGVLKTCCASDYTLAKLGPETDLVSEWGQGTRLNEARQKMIQGRADKEICRNCIWNEEQGFPSRRQRYKKHIEKTDLLRDKLLSGQSPRVLEIDVSLSRTCNLQCATCDSRYSSGWFEGDRKRKELGIHVADKIENFTGKNFKIHDKQVDQLISLANSGAKLVVKGGEPFLEPSFHRLVEGIDPKRIHSLVCVTNGTIKSPELYSKLRQIPRLQLVFSVDGKKDIHQWIRRATDKEMEILQENMQNTEAVRVNCVLSAFNIFTIDDWVEELLESLSVKLSFFSMHSVAKRSFENPIIFAPKYRSLMLEKLKRCYRLLENAAKGSNLWFNSDELLKVFNYIESAAVKPEDAVDFVRHYESILVPSRKKRLEELDPLFSEAYQEVLTKTRSDSSESF